MSIWEIQNSSLNAIQIMICVQKQPFHDHISFVFSWEYDKIFC
jgi:hypothetical protein